MPAASTPTSALPVRLWLAMHADEGWSAVVAPWLLEQAGQAWRDKRSTIVLVPTRAHGFQLHRRIVDAGVNLASIHFWTPFDARMQLQKLYPGILPAPSRAVLHALVAMAAEEVLRRDPHNRTAVAILAEPESFLRTADQLSASGWDLSEVAEAPLRAVVRQWRERLRSYHCQTPPEVDRDLAAAAKSNEPKLSRVLLSGFDGSHWAEQSILDAVIGAAAGVDFVLTAPRLGVEEIEQAWIGTWEEKYGAATPAAELESVAVERERPYQILQGALHSHLDAFSGTVPPLDFALGRNIRSEADSIVAAVLKWMQREDCTRLGIVFPGVGALAREVAARLEKAGLSCDDAFGFTQPGLFEREDWKTWYEFQQTPTLARFSTVLEHVSLPVLLADHPDGAVRQITRKQVESALRDAFKEVLLDDLPVLSAWMAKSKKARDGAAVECLAALAPIPDEATWGEFVAQVVASHRRLGWNERADRIELEARSSVFLNDVTTSRSVFLRWLGEVAVSTEKRRHTDGNHRYSRIHLVNYAEAEKQEWSHLILTSLSEGVWPPATADMGFLSGSEVVRLNRSIRRLTTGSITTGSQGEGHQRLEAGKGLCLGPFERRLLAESQTLGVLENVTGGVTLTARLAEEKNAAVALAPNEFFSRLYELARGKLLNDEECEKLCAASEKSARLVIQKTLSAVTSKGDSIDATAVAYAARRSEGAGFGEYEFALKAPPAVPKTLSCGEWESALKNPAAIWMRKYLRVAAPEATDAESFFVSVRGTWAHRLLACGGMPRSNRFLPLPDRSALLLEQEKQAKALRDKVERLLQECGRPLPIWWTSLWQEARFQARELASVLQAGAEWNQFTTEYVLAPTECDFSGGTLPPLRLEGRIDWLFAREPERADGTVPRDLWLIDFKTGGASKALSPSDMARGNGVQLALYALALHQLGSETVLASLVRPGELLREQMDLGKIAGLGEAWLELQRMQATGVFGVHGEIRSEYSHAAAYPLATLPVDVDLLADKWVRSHPAWGDAV